VLARSVRAFAITVVAVVAGLGSATHAHADPAPGSAAAIEAQIDQAWQQLEPLIEQYNGVHSQLGANKAKAAALQKQLQPLQLQVDVTLARVGALAAQAYKGGQVAALNAILLSGSPTTLADQLARLDQLARNQRVQISGVAAMRDKYAADKKALDALITQQAQQDADLAAKRQLIESQITNLQQLRVKAYGSASGGTGSLKPVACPLFYAPGPAGKAATTACAQVGKPYVWAADGPGSFDCSGLIVYSWKTAAGRILGHFTGDLIRQTRRIGKADLQPGDLVFFYSDNHHVGMYVGGGWMVHAPHPGDVVRMKEIANYGIAVSAYGRVT
jgi:cell wall-associated NlpC family hydrolase